MISRFCILRDSPFLPVWAGRFKGASMGVFNGK